MMEEKCGAKSVVGTIQSGNEFKTNQTTFAVEERISQVRAFGRKFMEARLETFLGCPIGWFQHAIRS